MGLPVNTRYLRAWAGHGQEKRSKRDEASEVAALDLEGTSGQPASHGMGKLVSILSSDIQGVELLGVREVYRGGQGLHHISLW